MTNHIPARKMLQWTLPALLTVLITAAAGGSAEPPETITLDRLQKLYEQVVFDHGMHMEGFDCSSCHHHTIGGTTEHQLCSRCHKHSGQTEHVTCSACHENSQNPLPQSEPQAAPVYHIDRPGLKGALHLQCVGCHRLEGGPVGCRECHEFSTAGKTRFQITESK